MNPVKLATWSMFFAGIVSMRFHPRNVVTMSGLDPEFSNVTIRNCAAVADLMMVEYSRRDPRGYLDASQGS